MAAPLAHLFVFMTCLSALIIDVRRARMLPTEVKMHKMA